jgi:hypothetical protein
VSACTDGHLPFNVPAVLKCSLIRVDADRLPASHSSTFISLINAVLPVPAPIANESHSTSFHLPISKIPLLNPAPQAASPLAESSSQSSALGPFPYILPCQSPYNSTSADGPHSLHTNHAGYCLSIRISWCRRVRSQRTVPGGLQVVVARGVCLPVRLRRGVSL